MHWAVLQHKKIKLGVPVNLGFAEAQLGASTTASSNDTTQF